MSEPLPERRVTETKVFTMMTCPACKREYAYTDWSPTEWWFPHICIRNVSVFTIPKKVATP